jgi:hypothetical protein
MSEENVELAWQAARAWNEADGVLMGIVCSADPPAG